MAHTADDHAETALLNISRGTGVAGLTMPVRRPLGDATLLRPLLLVRREAVRVMADQHAASGVTIVHDPTNLDSRFRRNRARLEVLPALGQLSGSGTDPVDALLRLVEAVQQDAAAVQHIAAAASARIVARWGPVRAVDWHELTALPAAVAARVVREELRQPGKTGDAHPPSRSALQHVLELGEGGRVTLPGGQTATRRGRWLILTPAQLSPLTPRRPGEPLPEIGVDVVVNSSPHAGVLPFWAPPTAVAVVPVPTSQLIVRGPDRHERIDTAIGSRRLWSAIRAVVPDAARPLVVVVADEQGPLWVPGVAVRAGLRDVGQGFVRLAPSGPPPTEASGAGAARG
jgi:tRNA(Ile)-lysidine synthase